MMPTATESTLSFDVLTEPWIDVLRADGDLQTLSLRQLLKSAHEIARVSEPSPLTEVALLRFLIALFSDGLRELVPDEDAWRPFAERCADGLPNHAVEAILAPLMGRSDVLSPDHDAFFDGPAVRRIKGWDSTAARQPVSRFLPELPSGTNLALHRHLLDDEAALCVPCLLRSRLVEFAFARGGLGPQLSRNLLATIGGIEPRYIVPKGHTLLETLLLNMVVGDSSRPSWIVVHSADVGDPGMIARLAWRPRLMLPLLDSVCPSCACAACGTEEGPRFSSGVMVDTYNLNGSPYGTQGDVNRWKSETRDFHLLAIEKGAMGLGAVETEWPLRALTRCLGGPSGTVLDRLPDRAVALDCPVTLSVTSSAGNQAKIDDAPHAQIVVPLQLLASPSDRRERVADALTAVFDKFHRQTRQQLIPQAVPDLLSQLVDAEDPAEVVANWLDLAQGAGHASPPHQPLMMADETDQDMRELYLAARRLVQRLSRLPASQLADLRPPGRGGTADAAVRQDAFEAVWYQAALPATSHRHTLRESLAVVAPIFALHASHHRPSTDSLALEESLRRTLRAERAARNRRPETLRPALKDLVASSPAARDSGLLRLVDAMVAAGNTPVTRIDFAQLLVAVACWQDPVEPTPIRWARLLEDTSTAQQ